MSQSHSSPDLASEVLHRIEEEHVTPRPRSYYILKNVAFWVLWLISLVAGSFAVAAAWFAVANADWPFWSVTHDNALQFFFEVVPLVWLIASVLMTVLGYKNLRRTKHGYRYPLILIVCVTLAGSLLGGTLLYRIGIGRLVEEEVGRRIPLYRPLIEQRRKVWVDPSRGLLAGDVLSVDPGYHAFVLRTFDGRQWSVSADDLSDRDRAVLNQETQVRVIGVPPTTSSTNTFHSCFVFPWEIPHLHRSFFFMSGGSIMPHPFDERNGSDERSTECKGVRPYMVLKALREGEASH